MRSAAVLLCLALTTSQASACATASFGNYEFGPGFGASYRGNEVLDYFIGHVESLHLQGSDSSGRDGLIGQAVIRVLRLYGAQNGMLQGTVTFQVPIAGCAGFNLAEGDYRVFGTYLKDGKRYIAGWPGPW